MTVSVSGSLQGNPSPHQAGTKERGNGSCFNITFASHFFQFDGSGLSRSLEGMLRSLLWQVLYQREEALLALMPMFLGLKSTQSTLSWQQRTLKKALISVIRAVNESGYMVLIFLDALNEFDGERIDIAKFCTELVSKCSPSGVFKLCVASRVDADFLYEFQPEAPGIVLEDKVASDMRTYVATTCRDVLEEPAFRPLVNRIIDKSNGVFLWVKLASNDPQRSWRRGMDKQRMLDKMETLPERLASLYRQILDQLDVDDRKDAIKMLSITAAFQIDILTRMYDLEVTTEPPVSTALVQLRAL
ncbi:hypothetical protein B0T24DRAFT_539233 [Lasiosphaeria ovina]|uniref:Nephrocystin 3-like N-terminal domain-containing protein n=1 Tax=Lasiosphaeria ovina TaxID=92902 RepID=A0AAE0JSL7_9PEZI|nr:hypothetical protein B0T24DRAFT_539233 [Lasiosphaeria ovina]